MKDITVNRFRKARGAILGRQIAALSDRLGRDITVLDIGGRPDYWRNVALDRIAVIEVLNTDAGELRREAATDIFRSKLGDARDLSDYADGSFDLVHSNSVLEHVGLWSDMLAMAGEARRVGRSGWIQTPAWEFPIEPHFRAPFLHWFGQPLRRRLMWMSAHYRSKGVSERRLHIDRSNLLSKAEVRALFPGCTITTERVILAKSYIARWMPDGMDLP